MKAKPSTIRCALYLRVSTSRQESENQKRQLAEFCGRQGWEIVHTYRDVASGSKSDRPQFKAMMGDASKRKFDVLIVWALDRMSREGVAKTLGVIQQLQEWGVQTRSYSESWMDTASPVFELVASIMAWAAKQERSRLIERTIAGLERARAQGKTLGRPRTVQGKENEILRLRAEGHSLPDIARTLGIGLGSVHRAVTAAVQ